MKKILSLIALLGMMVGSASAAPYYLPQPDAGDLTPYDWQPVYSLEGIYSFVDKGRIPDMMGARLNLSLYSDAVSTVRHQFTLSSGFDAGEEKSDGVRISAQRIPFTLGYDINIGLFSEHIFLDLGAKAGYASGRARVKGENLSLTEHMGGFTYALGAGIKVQCSDSIYVKIGYEFARNFFKDCGNSGLNFGQHGVVLGVGASW